LLLERKKRCVNTGDNEDAMYKMPPMCETSKH